MSMPEQNASTSFIKDYGTLIIAIWGVLQLWLVYVWKWFFRRRRVDLFTAEVIEIGYSSFGPTLGLYGTLTTIHKDSFVSNISLRVTRENDRAEHQFNWLAFRSNQFTLGPNQQMSFELPSGFMATPTQPHRYNILFSDFQQYLQITPLVHQIEAIWTDLVRNAFAASPSPNMVQLFDTLARSGRAEIIDFHTRIQRLCYWEAGPYSIEIRVRTSNPRQEFIFARRFILSDQDAQRLRLNAVSIFAEVCRQPNNLYNFAYATLTDR